MICVFDRSHARAHHIKYIVTREAANFSNIGLVDTTTASWQ